MDRRAVLQGIGGSAAALALSGCVTTGRSRRQRPNIVFIMTDDHAQAALSSYGNTILRTPNLDRIGAEGVRFTEAFVTNSLCLPSRATYLTGLYSHTHGLMTNGEESGFTNEPLLDNAATWPNLLRAAGYYTGVVGKWHVNNPPAGYDYTAVLPGQGMYFDPPIIVQGQMSRGSGHTDDVIGEQAIGFLNRSPADRPFALLYQFKAPHRGWEPAPRFKNAFTDIEIPPPPDLYESLDSRPLPLRLSDMRLADMTDYRNRGVRADMPEDERARLNWQHFIKDYYRVLLGVDENAGGAAAVRAMQGRSWLSVAHGKRVPGWRKDFLYEYFEFPAAHCVRKHRGVRTRRWKLIHWDYPEAWELYELATDPGEDRNLAGLPQYSAQEAEPRTRLAELRRELGDVDPPGYVPGDPPNLKHCKPVPGQGGLIPERG